MAQELDKFYTKKEVVDSCLKTIVLHGFDYIIEPSAGNGSFVDQFKIDTKKIIAMDIEPEADYIEKQDFLAYDINKTGNICVVGNPPFGRNGSLALKFFKKSATFANMIAFILPKSFKKESIQNKLPLNFHLVCEMDIQKNGFFYEEESFDIPCVWQIWEKRDYNRVIPKKLIAKTFSFVKKENANCAIRRVGINAGKAFLDTNKSVQSFYFIRVENPELFVEMVNDFEWEHNNTVGPRSISKQELIRKIERA